MVTYKIHFFRHGMAEDPSRKISVPFRAKGLRKPHASLHPNRRYTFPGYGQRNYGRASRM